MAIIIIVDDEVEILDPLAEMLSSEGYNVKAFSSSIKAESRTAQIAGIDYHLLACY